MYASLMKGDSDFENVPVYMVLLFLSSDCNEGIGFV